MAPRTKVPVLLHVVGDTIYRGAKPLMPGREPAWSPDGSQIAFVRGAAVWTANADGSGRRRIGPGGEPAWSPQGTLVFGRGDRIVLARSTVLGRNPSFSRAGRLALDRGGSIVAAGRTVGIGTDPAWSPDGRSLAFVREGDLYSIGAGGTGEERLTTLGDVTAPTWPETRRILFVSGRAIHAVSLPGVTVTKISRGSDPDLKAVPLSRELLPDLDQQAPSGIYVTHRNGRRLLAFDSAVANVGQGPVWIRGVRPAGHRLMDVTQLVRRTDGAVHLVPTTGWMRYDVAASHSHWHFHPFQRYELWRPGGEAYLVHDRKQGFCFGDRHPMRGAPPMHFIPGRCGLFRPRARSVVEGTSVRYVDIYPAEYHGQWIDLTGVRDGRYVLVHRSNPAFALRERSYANNVASALIDLRGDSVRVLRRCARDSACPGHAAD